MLTRTQLFIIGLVIFAGFITLFLFESMPSPYHQAKPKELQIVGNGLWPSPVKTNGHPAKESFYNVPIELTDTKFPNILNYLENAEEITLSSDENAGCFDNDKLLESIKGTGETCKSWAPKVRDIYYKKAKGEVVPASKLDNYFPTGEGKEYSFAEICPVTANQDLPIKCLYKKASQFNELGTKVASVIDNVQAKNAVLMDNLDDAVSYHMVDNNRLYNAQHVREFLLHEKKQNMNRNIRNTTADYLDDLAIYSNLIRNKDKAALNTSTSSS